MLRSNTIFTHGDGSIPRLGMNENQLLNLVSGMSVSPLEPLELLQRGAVQDLVQLSLEALLAGQPMLALKAADVAQERRGAAEPELWTGWSIWLAGLGHLCTNNAEQAQANMQQAHDFALRAHQPSLAMAAYLGQQLVTAQQHQQALRRQAQELQQQADNQEELLAKQFQAIIGMAIETLPTVKSQAANAPIAPAPAERVPTIKKARADELPPLEIQLFGEFRVFRGGEEINFKQNRKPADIFKYLLAHRERSLSTDTLLVRLWPDVVTSKGIHRLHLNISTLRQIVNPALFDKKQGGYIMTGPNSYYLNPQVNFELDTELFADYFVRAQALERSGKIEGSIQLYEAAAALYRDDYLIENLYDDWTAPIRDHFKQQYVDLMAELGRHYLDAGRWADAMEAARKMLAHDEYREDAHCFIMRALVGLNQRNQALRQYHFCAELLDRDLGVPPMPATNELYLKIKNSRDKA